MIVNINWIRARKLFQNTTLVAFAIAIVFVANVVRAEDRHWYRQQGKGRALCENLVHIANVNPTKDIAPNIPWKQVLAIKGVSEPEWTDLDPAKHERLFLMVRDAMAANVRFLSDEQAIPFPFWFKPPKERYAPEAARATPISDEYALVIYRDFVRRGGKLKVIQHGIGEENGSVHKDIVQFESPDSDSSNWDGYSLETDQDLSIAPDAVSVSADLGRDYRILR